MAIILMLLILILIALNVINIYYLYLILKIVTDKNIDKDVVKKRRNGNIAKVDFNNVMNGRKDPYDYLKNGRGLYEPVTGKKGIDLNTIKKKEV